MGNGWKSAVVCSLAIVGLFAFASDADAFGRRHRCGHHRHHGCHGGHQVAYAPAASCCDSAPVHQASYAPSGGCCGGGQVSHHSGYQSQGGCCGSSGGQMSYQGGYGGGYPVQQSGPSYAQPTSGCTNCQAPW